MKKTLLFGLSMLITITAISQTIQSQGLPFSITPVKANINDIILKVQRGELTEVPVSYTPRKKTGYPDDMPLPTDAKIIPFVGNNFQIPNPNLPNAVSPAPNSNFTGIIDNNSTIPPDVQGAVGPSHVFTVLNNLYRFQNRTGSVLSTISPSTFWAPTGKTGPFDPNIVYDPYNNRWIFSVVASAASANSSLLIAVSQTNDPTGTWNFYAVDADAANVNWLDYPSLGFNKDWITITGNLFSIAANAFAGAQIYVFDKATMYAGGAINSTNSTLITNSTIGATHTPAFTYDNSLAKQYILQHWNSSGATWRMWEITGTTHPLTMTSLGFPTNSSAWSNTAVAGPQSGVVASQYLDAGDVRMQSVVYRNGKLWGTQSIALPSTSPTRNAVQAWQINPTGLVVNQSIRIDDNTSTQHYFYPSIAVNANDDVLLGFGQSSASSFASSSYALRVGTDASGTINTPYTYKAGLAKYFKTFSGTRNRWGDYTSTVVDPVNDIDFWTLQEYAETPSGGSDLWGTHWAKVCFIPLQPATFTTSSSTICQSQSGVTYTVPAVSGATGYTWTYSGTGGSFSSTSNSVSINFSASATSGTLSVIANNACGSGIARTLGITVNAVPITPTISTNKTIICSGLGAVLTATGCTGTVIWSNGATGSLITVTPTVNTDYNAVCSNTPCPTSSVSSNISITVIPQNLTINSATPAPFQAKDNITTSGTVAISGNKTYKAGKSIVLSSSPSNTVSTNTGTVFEAKIEGCSY